MLESLPPPPHAIVEVYYDSKCAPCRLELPELAKAAADKVVAFKIVILGDSDRGRSQIAAASPALVAHASIIPGGDARAVLRAAGNEEGILPYARSVKSDGTVCAKWRGMLSVDRIRALLAACK